MQAERARTEGWYQTLEAANQLAAEESRVGDPDFPDFDPTTPVLIRTLAARHGDRELIVADDGRLSYAEADAISARMARSLLAAGAGKGTHVGICFANGAEWVLAWLAATRIGAVAVPLNTFFKARELGWMLRHADVAMLLTTARLANNDLLAHLEEVAPELRDAAPGALRTPALPHLRSVYAFGDQRPWTLAGRSAATTGRPTPRSTTSLLRAVEATASRPPIRC